MNRRAVLASCAVVPTVAGCLDSLPFTGDADPVAAPAAIVLGNRSDDAVDLQVVVTEDGTEVYNEVHTVERLQTGEETDHGYPAAGSVHLVADWLGDFAEYTFKFTAPEHGLERSLDTETAIGDGETAYSDAYDGDCYYVLAEIGHNGGSLTGDFREYDHDMAFSDEVRQDISACA
ncbi:hypothetical protein C483_07022 [Natrialba hulunbeirensis JCM 10989]|uniref:Lipoprotein n=1 Tax=Natrialba hulunbeirensis JCM 10989 TaxID=1227493 RepID=M0A259_9EURY|nr:hypothetical protein [Natrialba hulunbeirensis]ELY92699.1 hypothetical protein C483_07022 [Natrialba hulunbeirensis JCM 10989]